MSLQISFTSQSIGSMPKHHRSPEIPPPPSKRPHRHHDTSSSYASAWSRSSAQRLTFDLALYDELILHIFSYLSWSELCSVQAISKNWSRLAADNEVVDLSLPPSSAERSQSLLLQLWKSLYVREFGRTRLRGAKGFIGRTDGREMRPLPGRSSQPDDLKDWKHMFRISSNWRSGQPHFACCNNAATY
jgi:hypothetical protein